LRVGCKERDRWVTCLNDAAQLRIKDLYDYDEGRLFGRGRYAAVYPARRRDDDDSGKIGTSTDCALKIIDKNEFWRRVVGGVERADTIVMETSVQATLTAKCGALSTFLQIRGIFETCDHFVIELELLEGMDLFQHVSSKSVMMEEDESAQIMRDIFTSLNAMARNGIAHRDIKPANILMCNREKCGVSVKVADFGMSGFAGVDGHLRGRCGTPGYVAPEMWTASVHGGYGNKVDVFSAGVTLYVLLCGYEPFYGESDTELIAANKAAIVDYPEEDWSRSKE
jgi:serine/threonine protein kinase